MHDQLSFTLPSILIPSAASRAFQSSESRFKTTSESVSHRPQSKRRSKRSHRATALSSSAPQRDPAAASRRRAFFFLFCVPPIFIAMAHRDFDYGDRYYYDQGQQKRHRQRFEDQRLFDRDDDRIEDRLTAAERTLREQRAVIAELAGFIKEQQATIHALQTEAATAIRTEEALQAQVASLASRLDDLGTDYNERVVGPSVSSSEGSDGSEGSDAEGDGEDAEDGEWDEYEL